MKFLPVLYGALGGAAATSLIWVSTAPSDSQTVATESKPMSEDLSGSSVSAMGDWSPDFPAGSSPSDVHDLGESFSAPRTTLSSKPVSFPPLSKPSSTFERPATRQELQRRAAFVEEQANVRLEELAVRLGLTEEQQDRIFPILASSSPAYHPILRPEGGNATTTNAGGGVAIYGDGTSIRPGAPIAEVESEIYPELNEVQQASLEEEAMDREAWWEDIVGLLEDDLENSTSPGSIAASGDGGDSPSSEFTDEEREAASDTNAVDDFSNLLFGN